MAIPAEKINVEKVAEKAVEKRRVLGRGVVDGKPIAWMELKPLTGRTHQLRVHCAHMGWPILGDPVYGDRADRGATLHLLARSISVPLYSGKPPIEAVAPPPAHMAEGLRVCGGGDAAAT